MADIFFNEALHRYTDERNNVYTSVTTLIGQFEKQFDKEAEAEKCAEKGKLGQGRYVGMTKEQILAFWAKGLKESQTRGTKQHDELEKAIKICNNYNRIEEGLINSQLYTIPIIINNSSVGELSVDKFLQTKISSKFPSFRDVVLKFVDSGYRLYPEICTYNTEYLVSGLIDLLLLNINTNSFVILDYKTNKKPLEFRSGYYKKNFDGSYTHDFIEKEEYFKAPLNTLPYHKGNIYNLQLSTYAYLTELLGFKNTDLLLFHMRPEINKYGDVIKDSMITSEWHTMSYLKPYVGKMINTHYNKILSTINTQTKLNL